jgi:hypothetical protein
MAQRQTRGQFTSSSRFVGATAMEEGRAILLAHDSV